MHIIFGHSSRIPASMALLASSCLDSVHACHCIINIIAKVEALQDI